MMTDHDEVRFVLTPCVLVELRGKPSDKPLILPADPDNVVRRVLIMRDKADIYLLPGGSVTGPGMHTGVYLESLDCLRDLLTAAGAVEQPPVFCSTCAAQFDYYRPWNEPSMMCGKCAQGAQ